MSEIAKETNPRGQPLLLTPMFRKQIENNQRIRLAPPDGSQRLDFDRRIAGLDGEMLFALEAMRMLADQGNRFAAVLYEREAKRLGLWVDRKLFLPR